MTLDLHLESIRSCVSYWQRKERVKIIVAHIPFISDEEMKDIVNLYGKLEKEEVASVEQIEVWSEK